MQLSPSGPIKVLVIHGPNLNLLGTREPDVYGSVTFYELNELIVQEGKRIGCEVRIEQSNHEGVLIDQIHDARDWADAIVINAGAIRIRVSQSRMPFAQFASRRLKSTSAMSIPVRPIGMCPTWHPLLLARYQDSAHIRIFWQSVPRSASWMKAASKPTFMYRIGTPFQQNLTLE